MLYSQPIEKKAYTALEVAELLGVTRKCVYDMVKRGVLRAVMIGVGTREFRIPKASLEEYLKGGDQSASSTGTESASPRVTD